VRALRARFTALIAVAGLALSIGPALPPFLVGTPDVEAAPPVQAGPRPYRLPFAEPPGPGTWYVIQWYGNTTGAYRTGAGQYSAGQGIHFGVDFAAPCGSQVVAIGDGVVVAADGDYGSPPHNLVIRHDDGNLSVYGHLIERPSIPVGSRVAAGQALARSGDPYSAACTIAPHLHLEVRRGGRAVATNPVTYIDADWDSLSLGMNAGGQAFERDLDAPRRWQRTNDQPDITFGGRLINQYVNAWPP
jgi:murein DD-endopeptidase MepM/ murein hydrolase activator NlpD